jgi:hypothetical protein
MEVLDESVRAWRMVSDRWVGNSPEAARMQEDSMSASHANMI